MPVDTPLSGSQQQQQQQHVQPVPIPIPAPVPVPVTTPLAASASALHERQTRELSQPTVRQHYITGSHLEGTGQGAQGICPSLEIF